MFRVEAELAGNPKQGDPLREITCSCWKEGRWGKEWVKKVQRALSCLLNRNKSPWSKASPKLHPGVKVFFLQPLCLLSDSLRMPYGGLPSFGKWLWNAAPAFNERRWFVSTRTATGFSHNKQCYIKLHTNHWNCHTMINKYYTDIERVFTKSFSDLMISQMKQRLMRFQLH